MQQRETKAIRKRTFAELSASHSEPSFLSRAGDYLFGRKLASSGNSEVYIAVHPKTGQDVVCKVLKRLSPTTQRIEGDAGSRTNVKSPGPRRKEGKIHTQLHHPHILPLVDVFEATDRVCIVTKYARGGTLDTYVRQRQQGEGCGLPIEEAWRLFSQLVSAVAYLHASGFAHRDIKPDNILLDENGNVLLADFGLSCKFAQGRVKDKACGTVGFLAPCLLQDEVSYIGPELDCWALGMCLFFMLTGRNPFGSTSPLKMSKKVRLGRYQWRKGEPQGLVRDLVAKLLQIDVSGRATIDQVLNHPWITIRPEPTSARLPRRRSDLPTKVRKFKSAEGLSYKRLHTCELRSSPLSSISE